MGSTMKTREVCSFCQQPSFHYIQVKINSGRQTKVMCEECISKNYKGDEMAARRWLQNEFVERASRGTL
jgi:hypothetical protein